LSCTIPGVEQKIKVVSFRVRGSRVSWCTYESYLQRLRLWVPLCFWWLHTFCQRTCWIIICW